MGIGNSKDFDRRVKRQEEFVSHMVNTPEGTDFRKKNGLPAAKNKYRLFYHDHKNTNEVRRVINEGHYRPTNRRLGK